MRFDFHNSWLRLVIELFPPLTPIRRYQPAGERVAQRARRRMARHIQRQLRRNLTPDDRFDPVTTCP